MENNITQEHFTQRVQFGEFHSITDPYASDEDRALGRVWTLPGTKKLYSQSEIEEIAEKNGYTNIFD